MNLPIDFPIEDVQNTLDLRNLPINKVGIKSLRHPIRVKDKSRYVQHTVALCNMSVYLPHHFKGTHMSRFIEILNDNNGEISIKSFENLLRLMTHKLEAQTGTIEMSFPFFINKVAPVSGVKSLMDYEVTFVGEIKDDVYHLTLKIMIPVTSLCPCSKKISQYGAHNQRSHVTVTARIKEFIWIQDLIRVVEEQASSELYGLLKRPDEKFVTEYAYDNPKFVEDMVRDIAAQFSLEPRIQSYSVECENFESIHNHSAYAMISKGQSY